MQNQSVEIILFSMQTLTPANKYNQVSVCFKIAWQKGIKDMWISIDFSSLQIKFCRLGEKKQTRIKTTWRNNSFIALLFFVGRNWLTNAATFSFVAIIRLLWSKSELQNETANSLKGKGWKILTIVGKTLEPLGYTLALELILCYNHIMQKLEPFLQTIAPEIETTPDPAWIWKQTLWSRDAGHYTYCFTWNAAMAIKKKHHFNTQGLHCDVTGHKNSLQWYYYYARIIIGC